MELIATVVMTTRGHLTIPAEVCEELGVQGATLFEIEVRDGALVLRPSEQIPEEDLWAYRPEHLRQVERARADVRAGLVRSWLPDE